MVHRRTVAAIVLLLTLILLLISQNDSLAAFPSEKHFSGLKDEWIASHRLSGSVFSATGDPDEIASANQQNSKKTDGWIGDWVDACSSNRFSRVGPVQARGTFCGAFWHYILHCLLVGGPGFTD